MMLQTTMKAILQNNIRSCPHHHLYLIRDGETVFYVGKSSNPILRIKNHCSRNQKTKRVEGKVGSLIWTNRPESDEWSVELYTVEDLTSLIQEHRKKTTEVMQLFNLAFPSYMDDMSNVPYTVNEAEIALIQRYRPCLNRVCNWEPAILPDRYQKRKLHLDNNAVDYLKF